MTVLRIELPSMYQISFRNLTQVANCPTCGTMAHPFLVSSCVSIWMTLMGVFKRVFLEMDVHGVLSDLCSWRKVHAVKILPAKSV